MSFLQWIYRVMRTWMNQWSDFDPKEALLIWVLLDVLQYATPCLNPFLYLGVKPITPSCYMFDGVLMRERVANVATWRLSITEN